FCTVRPVTALPPTVRLFTPVRKSPSIVMLVPPPVEPELGVHERMTGPISSVPGPVIASVQVPVALLPAEVRTIVNKPVTLKFVVTTTEVPPETPLPQ